MIYNSSIRREDMRRLLFMHSYNKYNELTPVSSRLSGTTPQSGKTPPQGRKFSISLPTRAAPRCRSRERRFTMYSTYDAQYSVRYLKKIFRPAKPHSYCH